ncbi:MAG: hypothetical protein IJA12_01670, partial [Oscillospiraceae bacterium]|nr:hypothetical protein [Oscillospiraceae bacterium]
MKLKKWGSLLTAISMVASMAAYVPATVSANEISANYSAVQLAAEETEAVTTDLFSGTLVSYSKVSYTISSVVTPAATEDAEATTEYVLTLSPKTVNTVYTIPDEVIYELAYTLIGKTTEDTKAFATVSGLAANLNKVVVTGAAQISNSAFAIEKGVDASDVVSEVNLNNVVFEIDCQATYAVTADATEFTDIEFDYNTGEVDVIAGAANATIAHTMQAGTKNHKCKYGDKVDTSFEAHNFTKAGGATVADGAHICACGKSSEDYKLPDAQCTKEKGYDPDVHTWDTEKHECTDCGADMFFAHETDYVAKDSTTHVKSCTTCKKTLAEAEEHTYDITMGVNEAKACSDCGYEH